MPTASVDPQGVARPPLLEARGVAFRVGGKPILDPVDLALHEGSSLVVRGGNGAGKTTLLRILAGWESPSEGSLAWRSDVDDRREVSVLLGFPAFFHDLTVEEHLHLVEDAWKALEGGFDWRRLVEGFRIAKVLGAFPGQLSSGETQLVGLCIALMRPSRLLILDEPEHRLDEFRRERLGQFLGEYTDSGGSCVLATHDPVLGRRGRFEEVLLREPGRSDVPDRFSP